MAESDDSRSYDGFETHTEQEFRYKGLSLLNWSHDQTTRISTKTADERFRADFGPNPRVAAQVWEDMQECCQLDPCQCPVEHFFYSLNFLRLYPTETQRENKWNRCANYLRDPGWDVVGKIAQLKRRKIYWPEDNFGTDIWAMSVDGVHFRTEEPSHPELPKDPSYFTYKHHCAGFNYEIALSLRDTRCHWLNGPFKAGTYNDIKIFKECGLLAKLRQTGKKVIADSGYTGYPDVVSRYNSLDTEEVREFKSRARMRHEQFNGKLKVYNCLSSDFRHDRDKLQLCFEAVAVLVCYGMELGNPLYDT